MTISEAPNEHTVHLLSVLQNLSDSRNYYGAELSLAPNVVFTVAFGLVLLLQIVALMWSRNWYFGLCFIGGSGLEFVGYLFRCLSVGHESTPKFYIVQAGCLASAPTFITAGIYFLLAQLVIVQGPRSSIMNPFWFSNIFIACDIIGLIIQVTGGSITASGHFSSSISVQIAGICFQALTMTVFVYLLFNFYCQSAFNYMSTAPRSTKALFQILFATKGSEEYRKELNESYDPKFAAQRNKRPELFKYLPLALLIGVLPVYVRSIYRVAEYLQGYGGYLYKTESLLMVFDGFMILFTCVVLSAFHPEVVFGRNNGISLKVMTQSAREWKEASRPENTEVSEVRESANIWNEDFAIPLGRMVL